jgi:excisionase family DNA binding protein
VNHRRRLERSPSWRVGRKKSSVRRQGRAWVWSRRSNPHRVMPKLDHDAAMLTVKEAASLLRVNVKTIHKLLASGDLPHLRLGRVIRIPSRVLLSTSKSA